MKITRNIYVNYIFGGEDEANDFFEISNSEYLVNLKQYHHYNNWEIFCSIKSEPYIGWNTEPIDYKRAKLYDVFLGYERAPNLIMFGEVRYLATQKPTLIKKLNPIKMKSIR